MKKYIKPETELIKLNTQYSVCVASLPNDGSDLSGGRACAPRYYSDDEDETDATSTSW